MNREYPDQLEQPSAFSDLGVATESLEVLKYPRASARRPEPSWPTVLAATARLWFERRVRRSRWPRRLKGRHAPQPESDLARQMIGVALFVAGHRRAHLRDAWRSDLFTEDGQYIPIRRQLRHGAGYLIAAVSYRLVNDLGAVLGRHLDSMLASRAQTRAVVTCLYALPVSMILSRQGLYGLVTNAPQLSVLAAALGAGLRWLRGRRGVEPPKRDPESGSK
jgi:hypothetical protein